MLGHKVTKVATVVLLLCMGSAVRVGAAGLKEGFEAYAVGTQPGAPWTPRFNAVSDPAHNKVVDTVGYEGSKSLQLYGDHDGCWTAAVSTELPLWTEAFYISSVVMPGDESGGGCRKNEAAIGLLYDYTSGGVQVTTGLLFTTYDRLGAFGPTAFKNNVQYDSYEWYRIRMSVLPDYRRVIYSMDGHYLGSKDVPTTKWPGSGSHFHFDLSSGDGIGWFDDVRVDRFGAATPYLEPLSYLTDVISDTLATSPCGTPIPLGIVPAPIQEIYDNDGVAISAALVDQCTILQDEKKWVGALCGVDLKVTDPLGRYVDKNGGTLPGADYMFNDLDGDGDNEVCILLDTTEFMLGQYTVDVFNPDPLGSEDYSLFHYDPAEELLVPICVDCSLPGGGSAQHAFDAVPEPATLLLLGTGAVGILLRRRSVARRRT